MRTRVAILLLAVPAVAGCGVRTSKPYTAKGSAGCFQKKGFTAVTTAPSSLIAAVAPNGGLQATAPSGNVVTIAFAQDVDAVTSTEKAFRARATGTYKRHLSDVMSANRNAVLVWTVTPSPSELDTANRCLAP